MFHKYGLGLNVVSMEGRESKHVAIARYSKNSNFTGRWEQIFRHEFVQLIWLRERGYYESENTTYKHKYVPNRVDEEGYCFCGFELEDAVKCCYCSHKYRSTIEESVQIGKQCAASKKLLK